MGDEWYALEKYQQLSNRHAPSFIRHVLSSFWQHSLTATEAAAQSAKDDTDLTLRGYQSGLVATEKVIRAQLQEALVTAARDKAIYDHVALQAKIDLVVGKSVQAELSSSH